MITPSFGLTATERVLPKLALDFTTAVLDARVTFTRTTGASNPATYVGSNGYITAATNNQPRFDYDPVTLVCKGLLIEESRANVQINSNDFNSWAKSNVSVVLDATEVSPDGTNNANKITLTSTSGNVTTNPSVTLTATSYTSSVYAKKGNTDYIVVRLRQTGVTDVALVRFNLANGTVASTTAGSGAITAVGNGWYRCTVTGTAAAANHTTIIYPNNTSGQASGEYVFCYGAQLEAGAFATSYIPTTSAALTRNADVATMTGTNFSDWFNASEGTFACSFDKLGITSGESHGLWSIGNSSNTNNAVYVNAAYNGTYRTRLFGYNSTTLDVDVYPTTTYSANTPVATCFAYKANSYAGAVNAGTVATDTVGNVPSVVNMVLGALPSSTSSYLNGHIKTLNYYQQRLTNAEIQAFSKG